MCSNEEDDLKTPFEWMGARVRVHDEQRVWFTVGGDWRAMREWRGRPIDAEVAEQLLDSLRVDIQSDARGAYFDIRRDPRVELEVLDLRSDDQHLVLAAHVSVPEHVASQMEAGGNPPHSTFLCGHDEKSWFVAAIPESAGARDVQSAKDALKPQAVWDAMLDHGVEIERRDDRRTSAFVRQGEWFFIPRPGLRVDASKVRRNGRIQRGAGREHVCQFVYEIGGDAVYVRDDVPNGLSEREFAALPFRERWSRSWERRQRDAHVYVKGTVRHPDHKTVTLMDWHEVVPNTEQRARAMSRVAFLD